VHADFFPRDNVSWPFQQHGKNLERPGLHFRPDAVLAEFSRPQISAIRTELDPSSIVADTNHCCTVRDVLAFP
jgi:hypothetical protein